MEEIKPSSVVGNMEASLRLERFFCAVFGGLVSAGVETPQWRLFKPAHKLQGAALVMNSLHTWAVNEGNADLLPRR